MQPTNDPKDISQIPSETDKRPWTTPELIAFGDVTSLTHKSVPDTEPTSVPFPNRGPLTS